MCLSTPRTVPTSARTYPAGREHDRHGEDASSEKHHVLDCRTLCAGPTVKVASRARAHAREQMLTHLHLFRGSVGVMLTTVITSATGWLFWVVAAHLWSASAIGVASSL